MKVMDRAEFMATCFLSAGQSLARKHQWMSRAIESRQLGHFQIATNAVHCARMHCRAYWKALKVARRELQMLKERTELAEFAANLNSDTVRRMQ